MPKLKTLNDVKCYCAKHGISQKDLAKHCGVSNTVLSAVLKYADKILQKATEYFNKEEK